MSRPVFSASWYRVALLTPRLRSNARIHRHQYRGETWYVLQDVASERMFRFSPGGYLIIGMMDGNRTVQELWDVATTRLGDDAPTQDEMIQLLSQLQVADVLQCDVPPDTAELLRRYEERQRRVSWSRWLSPLSWRFPLFDPGRIVGTFSPLVSPLFSVPGLVLWLLVVGTGLVLAGVHWRDLTENVLDRILLPQNALLLWLCFPVVKAIHEFGHAFAVKAFGGEVHDMGIMLLVFTPIPYVDASSATAFRSKWQRIVVGLAGMGVELPLAAMALLVWVSAEPGTVRTLAYNVVLIAGISTILFNANPLLRYDGYYVLADLLEIPNLYNRSRAWLGYVVERYLFGRKTAEPPPSTPGERAWFLVYAVSSFLYRVLVVVAIALFLMERSFYLGALIGLVGITAWAVMPVWKGLTTLFTAPRLREVRVRAIAVCVLLAALAVGALAFVPVPFRSLAEGVVWVPDEALVRVGTEGFVERVGARPGTRVRRGDVLLVLEDRELAARSRMAAARVRELEAQRDSERPRERVKLQIVEEELRYARQELARLRERVAGLTMQAATGGTFVLFQGGSAPCECMLENNLLGRFVRRGDLLGYVLDLDRITVRAVLAQSDVDLVRRRTHAIAVRLSERLAEALPARLVREVPGASERLPSAALGSGGGGTVAIDPRDPEGATAMGKVFQVDLELPSVGLVNAGGRVYVRFDHGRAPLAWQWWREVRRIFLARFNV
ncbi:MAG: hypothetical protein HYU51_11100 [Candidatus Rokubacteria bacterium]|nr:hypothetical protein [Candidatus Rokubacteria bacterium]